jgi:hypothetical protein
MIQSKLIRLYLDSLTLSLDKVLTIEDVINDFNNNKVNDKLQIDIQIGKHIMYEEYSFNRIREYFKYNYR